MGPGHDDDSDILTMFYRQESRGSGLPNTEVGMWEVGPLQFKPAERLSLILYLFFLTWHPLVLPGFRTQFLHSYMYDTRRLIPHITIHPSYWSLIWHLRFLAQVGIYDSVESGLVAKRKSTKLAAPHQIKIVFWSRSHSTGEVELVNMDALPDELLKSVFRRLELFDTLRARAVCKRWLAFLTPLEDSAQFRDQSSSTVQSWCPLVFKRTGGKHDWCGYDSTSSTWQPLPSLKDLPQVDIRPLTGNGKALIGYKIMTALSQVVVGDPISSAWRSIPNSSEAWGEVGNILLVDPEDSASFQIVAVRELATEIFNSALGVWTKLRNTPPPGVHESTVLFTRDKLISATLCGGLLFCYGVHPGNGSAILVSFDVQKEQWTNDCIALPPHATSECFQMVECAGNLFTAIEDVAKSTVAIWGLGLHCREFFGPMVEMPQELYNQMCMMKRRSSLQLKAVGHQHRMFFWRNIKNPQTLCIVVFDFLLRTWAVLPEFAQGIGHFPEDTPEDLQTWVDTGSFEARNLKETNLL